MLCCFGLNDGIMMSMDVGCGLNWRELSSVFVGFFLVSFGWVFLMMMIMFLMMRNFSMRCV